MPGHFSIDDTMPDVEEPKHELTLEEFHKLHEQYNHSIAIRIKGSYIDGDTTFLQTTLIPRIFKRLDDIFEFYGIEHYEYVLTSMLYAKDSNTVIKFGNYQLFCEEYHKDKYINDTYDRFYIQVYVNYP